MNSAPVIVLLVDGDPLARAIAKGILKGSGCSIIPVRDAADALETFAAHHSDIALVLADAMLPDMDGQRLLLRTAAIDPRVPVILMTCADEAGRRRYREAGAAAVLGKPIQADALLTAFFDTLRRPTMALGTLAVSRARLQGAAAPGKPEFHWPPRAEDLDSVQVVDARTLQAVRLDPEPPPATDLLERVSVQRRSVPARPASVPSVLPIPAPVRSAAARSAAAAATGVSPAARGAAAVPIRTAAIVGAPPAVRTPVVFQVPTPLPTPAIILAPVRLPVAVHARASAAAVAPRWPTRRLLHVAAAAMLGVSLTTYAEIRLTETRHQDPTPVPGPGRPQAQTARPSDPATRNRSSNGMRATTRPVAPPREQAELAAVPDGLRSVSHGVRLSNAVERGTTRGVARETSDLARRRSAGAGLARAGAVDEPLPAAAALPRRDPARVVRDAEHRGSSPASSPLVRANALPVPASVTSAAPALTAPATGASAVVSPDEPGTSAPPSAPPPPRRTPDLGEENRAVLGRGGAPARSDRETQRIYAALSQYKRAYDHLDAKAALAVWPSLDARSLARAFGGLKTQQLEFAHCDVDVHTLEALAVCGGRTTYVPRVGSQERRTESREWTFRLKKIDEDWMIQKAEVR